MKPKLFLSYSRRELGFVDDLTDRLEDRGYDVWLDYRRLVPGTPWADQIHRGVEEADVILLVVSKAALASQYVELEWRNVVEKTHKRIILLIFEAVDLPPELEKYEWVDFRGSYDAGLAELIGQVEVPVVEEFPVPETGFKAPRVVWWAFGLSLLTAASSLFCLWSLFIPYFLLPLPYRVFKRDFNLSQVQTALGLLPIAIFLGAFAGWKIADWSVMLRFVLSFFAVPLAIVTILVLRSKGMQRWGKPEASLIKLASRYTPEELPSRTVAYFIDHAPEDRRVADELAQKFREFGHQQTAEIPAAEVVVLLLSKFKRETNADVERQHVLPVMIQTCEPADALSKIQWIDLRRGLRNLDAIAKLLPEPTRLMAALGVRPSSSQLVMPPIIMGMRYFLLLLGIFILGSGFRAIVEEPAKLASRLSLTTITMPILGALIYFMLRSLTHREGFFSSFLPFSLAVLALGLPVFAHTFTSVLLTESDTANMIDLYPLFAYVTGLPVLLVFLAFRFRDVRRWFPAKPPRR